MLQHHPRAHCEIRVPRGLSEADIQLLLKLPLFAGLSRPDLFHLIGESWVERQPAGALMFLQGDRAESFFAVLDGWVKLFRSTAEGNESVIAVMPRGESFAEAAAFEEGTYPVSAGVIEDSRLLVIPAAPFLEKVILDGRLVVKMMASMSRRLRQLVCQVEDLSLKSSVERVASYISTLCEPEDGPATVHLPLDKALIARHLGMQPETLSRSLARLRGMGIVADGERVQIPDVAILRQACGENPRLSNGG